MFVCSCTGTHMTRHVYQRATLNVWLLLAPVYARLAGLKLLGILPSSRITGITDAVLSLVLCRISGSEFSSSYLGSKHITYRAVSWAHFMLFLVSKCIDWFPCYLCPVRTLLHRKLYHCSVMSQSLAEISCCTTSCTNTLGVNVDFWIPELGHHWHHDRLIVYVVTHASLGFVYFLKVKE